MIITVTSLQLRSVWHFFKLSYWALQILKQTKNSKGLIAFKKTGSGLNHYTLSVWETEEDMKSFYRSGAHASAMKRSAQIARKIATYSYTADSIPSWAEAKKTLQESGNVLSF